MLTIIMWLSMASILASDTELCGELYLTEVHPDPAQVSDRIGEFIEIYNAASSRQSTVGWSLVLNDERMPLPVLEVEPQGVLILSRGEWALSIPHTVWKKLRLPNRAGHIRMVDRCDTVRQTLSWGRHPRHRVRSGRSLELVWHRGGSKWRQSRKKDGLFGDRASPGRVSQSLSRRLVPRETQFRPTVLKPIGSIQKERQIGD